VHRNLLVAQVLARRLSVEPFLGEVLATSDLSRAARPGPRGACWDVLVLDSGARGPTGIPLLGSVMSLPASSRVMLLGEELDDPVSALTAGARGWIPVDVSIEFLVEAVRAVSQGRIWLPPQLYPDVVDRLLRASDQRSRLAVLTERQLQVLQALVNGQTTQETAATLFMSPNTVRTHRARLFTKLGVHYALEAVVLAREAGLSPE
jgi:DNA-binding NarL/FixJ family response regulator